MSPAFTATSARASPAIPLNHHYPTTSELSQPRFPMSILRAYNSPEIAECDAILTWRPDVFRSSRKIIQELEPFGLQLLQFLGDDYPRPSHLYSTDWYYYVFSKTEVTGEK